MSEILDNPTPEQPKVTIAERMRRLRAEIAETEQIRRPDAMADALEIEAERVQRENSKDYVSQEEARRVITENLSAARKALENIKKD